MSNFLDHLVITVADPGGSGHVPAPSDLSPRFATSRQRILRGLMALGNLRYISG